MARVDYHVCGCKANLIMVIEKGLILVQCIQFHTITQRLLILSAELSFPYQGLVILMANFSGGCLHLLRHMLSLVQDGFGICVLLLLIELLSDVIFVFIIMTGVSILRIQIISLMIKCCFLLGQCERHCGCNRVSFWFCQGDQHSWQVRSTDVRDFLMHVRIFIGQFTKEIMCLLWVSTSTALWGCSVTLDMWYLSIHFYQCPLL